MGSLLLAPAFAAEPAADSKDSKEPLKAEAWSVLANGASHQVNAYTVKSRNWFDAEDLAAALGYRLQVSTQGFYVQGQPLRQPIVMVGSRPFTTAEAMAQTLSAKVDRDSVRKVASFQLASGQVEGIPYYSADYVTPAERAHQQRVADHPEDPGQVMLEEWDEQMAEEWNRKHPFNPYVRVASDIKDLKYDKGELPRIMTKEEVEDQTAFRRTDKPYAPATNYLARSASNGVFRVTVTDVKLAEALKGMQPPLLPDAGNKFLVVHLRVENISKKGQHGFFFQMRDQNGTPFQANDLYSKLPHADMRVNETYTGYLIFEIPMAAQPVALEAQVSPALSMSLIYR